MIDASTLQMAGSVELSALLFLVGTVVSILIGFFVGYRAYRAYQRTQRRQLLLFGVGLLLLVSVSKLTNIVFATASPSSGFVGPATESVRLVGAVIITYAIYDQ